MMVHDAALAGLTVGDLMTRPVEVVRQDSSLPAAARQLRHAQVSGAPVVDDAGRCVGVLSAGDFVRWAEDGPAGNMERNPALRSCQFQKPGRTVSGRNEIFCTLERGACPVQVMQRNEKGQETPACLLPHCVLVDWQVVLEATDDVPVSRYMTGDPVLVTPDTPLPEAARMMLDAHIHRVIVVNDERHPVGILTSMDLIAAVARLAPPR